MPDAICDVCAELIGQGMPRYRCPGASECDEFDVCPKCAATDAVIRAHEHNDAGFPLYKVTRDRYRLVDDVFSSEPSSAQAVQRAFEFFAPWPCLGTVVLSTGDKPSLIRWRSYTEVGTAVEVFARALRLAVLDPEDSIVALCAPNSPAWLVADFACVVAKLPTACVDHTLGVIDAVIAASDAADKVQRTVRLAIVSDEAAETWAAESGLSVTCRPHATDDQTLLLSGLALVVDAASAAAGTSSFRALADSRAARDAMRNAREMPLDAPFTALYTSGSTGIPKPRWINARSWLTRNPKGSTIKRVTVVPVFSPLSHGLGRRQAWRELTHGGRIGLLDAADGLLEQLALFEPSSITAVPAFYSLLMQRYEFLIRAACEQRQTAAVCYTSADALPALRRSGSEGDVKADAKAAQHGVAESTYSEVVVCEEVADAAEAAEVAETTEVAEVAEMVKLAEMEEAAADELAALRATRLLLGRRMMHTAVGGAYVPRATLVFLQRCFGIGGPGGGNCIVSNGYGATETGGIARDGELLPQWKPPLGECVIDEALGAALGQPAGVGEILLRSATPGFIAASLDVEGWYRTGDLGKWVADALDPERGPRRIEVVDRAGFAVKLSNGEFVCPQVFEAFFESNIDHDTNPNPNLSPSRKSLLQRKSLTLGRQGSRGPLRI